MAWHPEENPLPDYMQAKALETLSLLGLSEHEAVLVAHQETDHSDVHVIVNLVHPETGKTAVVYKDRVKLSQWAEEYEKEKGKIYCEERVANNEIRKGQIPPEEKNNQRQRRTAKPCQSDS
ncbi:MAG: relaxase/mobilization nuclease domain-containing protein [Saprospiraceae bacterium]|nr:relaxase/mobilization nuclease domain-containing protein [Saprospiraceae bacterium]